MAPPLPSSDVGGVGGWGRAPDRQRERPGRGILVVGVPPTAEEEEEGAMGEYCAAAAAAEGEQPVAESVLPLPPPLARYLYGDYDRCSTKQVSSRTSTAASPSTRGYKASKYASRGVYSMKTDVFNFGVLVLVIISGRKNTIIDKRGDIVGDLVREDWHMWKEQRLHELVDPFLAGGYKVAEIRKCSHVAMPCAQEDPAD
ncbi:cysteine-rich receptor-like protein kinase 34 [Aegilops tauschii subsp. strangulata]|uniref:cysteine-rich receptor-like protein kinase 34 n=1 Tax=Aegilops tauschii subsp. strangulata TaxID=200361 RepID=UPI00098BAD58